MSDWFDNAKHWRQVVNAAKALKDNPDPLFAELGRALHAYHVGGDRAALADALDQVAARLRAPKEED